MAKRNNYKQHQIIGSWKLDARLGKGGNGEVWRVHKQEEEGAIKLLKNIRENIYKRFKAEVHAITMNSDISGVVGLKEYDLPDDITRSVPWFVMPVGMKFSDWREGKEVLVVAKEMLLLAKTLEELHDRQFYHRDIKPANILYMNGRLCLADFGLVKYPNRDDVTEKGKDVGPKYTMAPEMRRNALEANGEFADIYSFAKTLWIAITEDLKCFDGQYNIFSTVSINNYCNGLYTKSLNDLLTDCTEHTPEKRPKMSEVVVRLEEWIKINEDFHEQNLTEWFDLQNRIFPAGSPDSVTWTNPSDIITILNEIAHVRSLNHMFLPGGGGNTFIGADYACEQDFIALKIAEKMYDILKPSKLTYESFGVDPQWNYFRLEAEPVEKTGVYGDRNYVFPYEELVEIEPAKYIERYHWDYNEYNGEDLPEESHLVCRYFEGAFVVFSTRSIYNLASETYDGRHNKMSESEFREYIQRNAARHKDAA
ncbi:serine/threonine protein kinase [Vibrio alginolyticus]|uniref:serine/threonine protein kinase n=1 Tax=Vibrio alginolyticus TaxID=663 RepID=UPI001C9304D7|nr:protein kinase [Vibrio alginolyticus]MBY4646648.1 protein kinase [Vibrio alginolyticus]